MNYHPEDFAALSEAVEHDGGKLLAEPCEPKKFKLRLPDLVGKMRNQTRYTTGCGFSAKMRIPYDPTTHIRLFEDDDLAASEPVTIVDHPGEAGDPGDCLATVCAVDDCVGLWPRYKGVVSSRSYQPQTRLPSAVRHLPE